MKIVLSIGGSILAPDEIDTQFINKLAELLRRLSKTHELIIVTGGGKTARKYIKAARKLGAGERECDLVGIEATYLNASLLATVLGDAAVYARAGQLLAGNPDLSKIVVTAGTVPGHSTDAVAVEFAVKIGADLFVNASNIKAVYDKDPRTNHEAKPFECIAIGVLESIVRDQPSGAGEYPLIDMPAIQQLKKSRIRTVFLDGRNLENLEDAVSGRDFKGTEVTY